MPKFISNAAPSFSRLHAHYARTVLEDLGFGQGYDGLAMFALVNASVAEAGGRAHARRTQAARDPLSLAGPHRTP